MRISERLPNILKYPPPGLTSLVKMMILIIGFCERLPNILKYPLRYVLAVKWLLEEFSFTGSHKLYLLEVVNKVSLEYMTKASLLETYLQ